MIDWATIYPDGRMTLDGCVPNKWRLMGINSAFLAYHAPGATWWDNGGKNYGPASIEVTEIEELRPGNEPGTWRVKFKRLGRSISFHPTPKEAAHEAAGALAMRGDQIMAAIKRRQEE